MTHGSYTGPDPGNPNGASLPRPTPRRRLPGHNAPPQPPPADDASCVEHPDLPPDSWFGDPKYGDTAAAREVCLHDCPVREQCIDYSLSIRPDPPGIWAGLNSRQRLTLRQRRGLQGRRPAHMQQREAS